MQDKLTLIFPGIPPQKPKEEENKKEDKKEEKEKTKPRRRCNRVFSDISYRNLLRKWARYLADGPARWALRGREAYGILEGGRFYLAWRGVELVFLVRLTQEFCAHFGGIPQIAFRKRYTLLIPGKLRTAA